MLISIHQLIRPLGLLFWSLTLLAPSLLHGGETAGTMAEVCTIPAEEIGITADFCAVNSNGYRAIELTAQGNYFSYRWYLDGVEVPDSRNRKSITVDIAGTYTLRVTSRDNCTGTTSISTSEELIENGDFENLYYKTFETDYRDETGWNGSLQDEGTFAVDTDARDYHNNFYGPRDHTTGKGKYLMVNGHRNNNMVIWEQTVDVEPGIDYYFSAWATNLHGTSPAQLQFFVNGRPAGTIADLRGISVGNWIRFYSPSGEFWNSGTNTTATIRIVNLNTAANGNDFGIDDISFGNLDPLPFTIDPPEEITICATHTLNLYANLEGGRDPISFKWTGPNGFVSYEENPEIQKVSAANAGTYTLTVTDFYGCGGETATTQIIVDEHCHNLDFDGENDYILIGDHFDPGSSFSLEAWVKPNSDFQSGSILSKTDLRVVNANGYELGLVNGKPFFRINSQRITSDHSIFSDRWYHLAASFDAASNTATLYIDGIQIKETQFSSSPVATNYSFIIGASYNSDTPWDPGRYFHGWIEEVRIWDLSLKKDQIRFMMNQRLKQSETGTVEGGEIPLEVPGSLSWNRLKGYYQLLVSEIEHNEEAHDENHGITRNKTGETSPGLLVNMTTNQENTAPLPYFSKNPGNWSNTGLDGNSPWAHPAVWNAPNTWGVNGKPIDWNIVRVAHDITTGKDDITLLGLISENRVLKVTNPTVPQDEYNSGIGLRITRYLYLNGKIDLVGESQLLQDEGSILEEKSRGELERDQQGTASSYNYNYWSSPVSRKGSLNNAPYRILDVLRDGTIPETPGPIVFNKAYHWADGAYPEDTKRISTYWLNKFTRGSKYSQWIWVGEKGEMKVGEGYSMKGTSGSAKITDQQNYTFIGKPHNGTIELELVKGNSYLIGNPYPSAIDGYQFIRDNLSGANGGIYGGNKDGNVFNGTLYFWDHFGGKSHYLQEYIGGYATLNLSGGTEAIASDARINATGEHADPAKRPQQFIPVGQGFYVNTSLDPQLEEITSVSGGTISFRNSQRVFETDDQVGDESQFKSHEELKRSKPRADKSDPREKIYLRLKSPMGYQRQLLVTADPFASNDFDLGYDAPLIDNNKEDMYWFFKGSKFVIQGVGHLQSHQELPLGIKIAKDSVFSIEIDELQNIPETTDIFLKDSLHELLHDLRKGPYLTSADPGEIHNRFKLVFRDANAVVPEENIEEEPEVVSEVLEFLFLHKKRELLIRNPELIDILEIRIYNSLGQLVAVKTNIPHQEETFLPIESYNSGVYIIEANTATGIFSQKIIQEP